MIRSVWLFDSALCLVWMAHAVSVSADVLSPVDVRQVKVGGEIGRRIDVTCANNLMVLDLDKDFLPPFQVNYAVADDANWVSGLPLARGRLMRSARRSTAEPVACGLVRTATPGRCVAAT
jgi:hypothetical protein